MRGAKTLSKYSAESFLHRSSANSPPFISARDFEAGKSLAAKLDQFYFSRLLPGL